MASEGVNPPLPAHGQPGGSAADVGPESPAARRERGLRALDVGARLLCGATIFFFMSFLFAYFYLRAINQEGQWRAHPPRVDPSGGLGLAIVLCVVVSALLAVLAHRRQSADGSWSAPVVGAIALGLIAVALQCIEYTRQKWGPTDGAYASVYIAWTGFYAMFVLGAMYWLEINVATEIRERRKPTARAGEGETVYEDPDKLLPRGIGAPVFYWTFLAGIGVVTYVVLYLA
jgi:heme/copper-type cytochrome/quinol oxidase subunit 3